MKIQDPVIFHLDEVLSELGNDQDQATFSRQVNERLSSLCDQGKVTEGIALFEAAQEILAFKDYWSLYNVMTLYTKVNDVRAAYIAATLAHALSPLAQGEHDIAMVRFNYCRDLGAQASAAKIFRQYAEDFASTIRNLSDGDITYWAARAGLNLGRPSLSSEARRDIEVVAKSERPPWQPLHVLGGRLPWIFSALTTTSHRSGIYVSELDDGELLAVAGNVAIYDSSGAVQKDISVGENPEFLEIKYGRSSNTDVPLVEIEVAVLMSDQWSHTNICHYLMDHFPRLRLYEMAGVEIEKALVIGSGIGASFQQIMLHNAGVCNYLSVAGPVRVCAKKLYVASSCRDFQPTADRGAQWATNYIRKKILTPSTDRRRIYISRADSGRRKVLNEEEVFNLLEKYGFELVTLSNLPFNEQVQIFSGASHIIGAHGAGLSLSVFCQPGSHVLEIFHPCYFYRDIATMALSLGLNWSVLTALDPDIDPVELEDIARWWEISRSKQWGYSDMIVQIDQLRRYLELVL